MNDEVVIIDIEDEAPDWASEDTEDEKPVGPEDDPNTADEAMD